MTNLESTEANSATQGPVIHVSYVNLCYLHRLCYAMVTGNTNCLCHTMSTLGSDNSTGSGPTFLALWSWTICISVFVWSSLVVREISTENLVLTLHALLRSDAPHFCFTLAWPKQVKWSCSISPGENESFSYVFRDGKRMENIGEPW